MRVYDRAISAAQITGDMNTPVGGAGPAPPQLSVTPTSLSFSATQGAGNPAAKSLAVANTGGGTLSFSASDNAPWLSVTPGSGTAPQSLTVAANISGLSPGTHTATVTVTSAGSQGSPATIPVTLTVDPAPTPPQLSVTPASLSFSATQGAGNPAAKSLSVANTGGGTLTFSASDDAPWLLVTPASGTAPQSLTVSADISGLPPGEHTAAVTVDGDGRAGLAGDDPGHAHDRPRAAAGAVGVAGEPDVQRDRGRRRPAGPDGERDERRRRVDVVQRLRRRALAVGHAGQRHGAADPVRDREPRRSRAGAHTATITVTAAGATGSPKTVAVTLNVASAPPPTAGLVAAYGFDEPSGTVVNDASGAGNPGVISGATRIAAGRFGGGLSFDGVNDWVTVAHAPSLDMTTAMTLEAWVYPTITTGWRTAILKERTAGLTYALYANEQTRRPIGMGYTTNELGAKGSATLPLNQWSHLVATYAAARCGCIATARRWAPRTSAARSGPARSRCAWAATPSGTSGSPAGSTRCACTTAR